jgi:predicted Fe-S protein YdhL (DUF1289 family)
VLYLSRRATASSYARPAAILGHESRRVIEIPSPCIGVCRLDPGTGLCAGCMRTLDEIAIWPAANEAERLAIVQRLRARRRAAGRTSAADRRPRRRRSVMASD